MRHTFFLALATVLMALGTSNKAQAWGAYHVGYTHVGYGGAYHYGRTEAYRPYGDYGGASMYHYGYGGYGAYGNRSSYYYPPRPGLGYGGYHYGGYYGGYRSGVYRAW
jgi:hypothetical protein